MSHRVVVLSVCAFGLTSLGLRPTATALGAAAPPDRLLDAVSFSSATDGWAVGRQGQSGSDHPIARHWDGTHWQPSILPVAGEYTNQLLGVDDRSQTDVWAVGWSTDTPESGVPLAEHWDGGSWTIVPSPDPSHVHASYLQSVSAVSADDVWAVGYRYDVDTQHVVPFVLHGDGSQWQVAAAPKGDGTVDRQLDAVTAVSANDVWAVGRETALGGKATPIALHFDGIRWRNVTLPTLAGSGSLDGLTAVSSDDVWAVGSVTEHWDGTSWAVVDSPPHDLNAVSASASDDVWAVGGSYSRSVSEHWDGRSWTVVETPNVRFHDRLLGVAAVSAHQATAVGYSLSRTRQQAIVLSWDGSAWSRCRQSCTGWVSGRG